MALNDLDLEAYLQAVDANQEASIRLLRELIFDCEPEITEKVDDGKWFGGLLVFHASDGTFVYALGPRSAGKTTLHMMPYYCSSVLQGKHGAALKKFASGKSCLLFTHAQDLPLDAIRDICTGGAQTVRKSLEELEKARRAKKKKVS